MTRFFLYHAVLAVVFLLIWALLAVIEVRIAPFGVLRWIFFDSLPLVFASFLFATLRALRSSPRLASVLAVLSCVVFSPLFILAGVVLVTNLKFLLGGHL